MKLLKGHEVAEILGVSKAYAYKLMSSGEITTIRIGKAVRVREDDLEIFINEHTINKSETFEMVKQFDVSRNA